jgi:CRP/FNR family transcriptional regulator, cyclic AMP receptor protein
MEKSPRELLENILALKHSVLFSAVDTRELEAVAMVAAEVRCGAGEAVVTEGEVGDSMFLIKQGRVSIVKRTGAGKTAKLAELTAGECFGEMSVIDEEVRSASVVALAPCSLLRIGKDALLDVVLGAPLLGVELLKIFVKRVRAADQRIQELSKEKEAA